MAITQTDFSQYADIGFNGQLNTDFPWWASSPIAEGSYIGFGVAVAFGNGDETAVIAPEGVTAGQIIGITLKTQAVAENFVGTPGDFNSQYSGYGEGRPMSVLQKGRMYIQVEDGATRGDGVYVTPGTGVITSTAGEAGVQIPNARFVKSAAAGEIAEIELA